MKATMVKFVGIIAIIATLTGCGALGRVFGHEVIDTIKDETSITTIKKVGNDRYVFEVEASKEALDEMSNGEEGIYSMTVIMEVDEAYKDEFLSYMNDHTAISF